MILSSLVTNLVDTETVPVARARLVFIQFVRVKILSGLFYYFKTSLWKISDILKNSEVV